MVDINKFDNLTSAEKEFAELYLNGSEAYAGNPLACYRKVFGCNTKRDKLKAMELLTRKDIQEYIVFIDCPRESESIEARIMRRKITEKLMKIGDSCAEMNVVDRRGTMTSPASLRSVSVNAYRLIAEINGIKKNADDGGESAGGGSKGITFNVIVPSSASEVKVEQEEAEQ